MYMIVDKGMHEKSMMHLVLSCNAEHIIYFPFFTPLFQDLIVVPGQLESAWGVLVVAQVLHDLFGGQGFLDDAGIGCADKATGDGIPDPLNQACPVVVDIVDDDGHAVDAQLVPGGDLHELLKGAVAAAQGNKATASAAVHDFASHHLLAGVHVLDDGGAAVDGLVDGVRVGVRGVVVLLESDEGRGDDAVDCGRAGEGDEGAGYFAHEADCAATVDEFGARGVEGAGEGAGGLHVGFGSAFGGAAAEGVVSLGRARVEVE